LTIRVSLLALLLLISAPVMTGCATSSPSPEVRQILAPTGPLRVALYVGTPSSVLSATDLRGVGHDLGRELARQLKAPFAPMVLEKNADVQAAIRSGKADVAFTNASPERARDMDFTQTHLAIELGYLTGPRTSIQSLAEVDQPGVKVGVTAGSTSQGILTRQFKNAQVVTTATLDAGVEMLAAGSLDLYATNKANLYAMGDKLPGSRVLDGAWGVERHAMGIPKGREAGLPYAKAFIAEALATGKVKAAVARAGLRGAIVEPVTGRGP
jgi:polar amino acid transport system substrate-binding protein